MTVDALIDKIRRLPPEKAAEVEDFVDFLSLRQAEHRLGEAVSKLSEEAFAQVWENSEDTVYDEP